MLALLRPFFRGDWTQYGESLQLADAAHSRPSVAQWLADPFQLDTTLARHAEFLNAPGERKAVASDWMLRYLTSLLPPIVALSSLLKYSVRAGLHDMAVMLNGPGEPAVFVIADLGTASPGADAVTRYDTLVWQHLEPLIAHLVQQTKVPAKILRGNVRRALLDIFEHALSLVGADPALTATLREDRHQLLESATWPDGRRNPLFLRHRRVPATHGGTRLLTLHASCCLAYQLPRTGYCEACPLAPKYLKRAKNALSDPAAQPIRRTLLAG